MKVEYILGRAGSGKTHRALSEIRDKLKEGKTNKLILLVPEQFTLQAEADLIEKMNLPGLMRVEVLSFERLAYKVFSEVGGLKKSSVNDLGKIMILRKLFDQCSNDLSIYKKASKQEGFLSNFSNLVSEFKRNEITYEALNLRLGSMEEDSVLKRKLSDIAYMYQRFNEYMEDRYTDEDDKFSLLIEKIEGAGFLVGGQVWVDGFHGFSSQEYKILEKLMQKAEKVTIALTLDKGGKDEDLFIPTARTLDKLKNIVERNAGQEKEVFIEDNPINKPEELVDMERQLYSYPYRKFEGEVHDIEIFSGTNRYTEIENAASKIVSLVRDKGYRWKDIALVSNFMDAYSLTIKRVFSEYGIPYFLDEKRMIMDNPIIKLIMSALEIVYRNFKYEDVFKFIKTGFSDLNKNEYEALENYVLKYGIYGDFWDHDFKYEEENLDHINEIRGRFVSPFINLKKKLKRKNKVSDLTRYLFEFLTEINIEEKLNNWIHELKAKGNLEYVNENTQIWNIVMEIFDQMVEILEDTQVSLREYSRILEAGFGEYKVGIIPPTIDQVLVGSLERSKSHDIKALFVVGVNDGILPSTFDDGGLLLDDEKVVMKDMGIDINSDNQTRVYEERLSIYSAFTKPSEYLWISYALSDDEGKSLRPSIIIDRFKKLYKNIIVKSDITKDIERQLSYISTPFSTFKYLVEYIREDIDQNPIDHIWWDVYEWYFNNDQWRERLLSTIEGFFHNNQQPYINEEYSKALYELPFKSSISRLERFINCPFAHFINYGLKPSERKVHTLKSPDVGMLFHNSMEEFAKELTIGGLDWKDIDRAKCDELTEKILDKMVPEFQYGILHSTHRYKYLVNKLKRISKRALWTITEQVKRGEFVPLQHEVEFGEGPYSKIPPIVIKLPNGEEIKLEGRIDRVDMLKDGEKTYVKVIDYKSGSKKFSLSDVYYGLQIQLIVYLDALLANKDKLTKDELYPGGVFYFRIDDPMINTEESDLNLIEKEIMKQLKLDGMIVKDINVVKAMDTTIEDERSSVVIPVSINKDGSFSKSSSVMEPEDIEGLMKHVRTLISEITMEILKGKIKIEPCKVGNQVSCQYCDYGAICQFDTSFEENTYRNIKKLKDEEVLERIRTTNGGEE